jgi:tetratricopeptide (TPR) repeat protein
MFAKLPSIALLPCLAASIPPQVPANGEPTWSNGIGALVYRSCTPCHRPGQPAPFPLLDYDDAASRRKKLAEAVAARTMPPWLITAGEFHGDRQLTDSERQQLLGWLEGDAKHGDPAAAPRPPMFASDWQLRPPDLVIDAPIALPVPADGPDLVRNLVLPVDLPALRYVEAVEIRPDNAAVHHAILAVDRTRESERLDAADPEPGFGGMTLGAAEPPDGHFLGWTPGKSVRVEPPGHAWRLRPGDHFVLQLHCVPTGKAEVVTPRIGVWFTDVPTSVEFVPLVLFSEAIDIAPGERDYVVRDHLRLPVAATLHAIYPHAHYLGRQLRAVAKLPDGREQLVFAIDAWDFDWQDDYRLRTPMALPAGTEVAFEYRYDNSEQNLDNPHRPPQRVRFGQASSDEMATLTLAVTAADAKARRELRLAAAERDLEKLPRAFDVWLRAARLQRERGDLGKARGALQRAVELAPGHPDVGIEQGLLAEEAGRLDEAAGHYRAVLAQDPARGLAHLQLGTLEARAGRTEAALRHFSEAQRVLPNAAAAHNNFATALFQLERLAEAVPHFERALQLEPDHFGAQFNLGRVLARLGRVEGARAALSRALALRPGTPAVEQELAALPR